MRILNTWTKPQSQHAILQRRLERPSWNSHHYATDGITSAFAIHFPFFDDTDVNAVYVDASGNATPLVLNADYTVSGGGGAGGTLTAMLAPADGGALTIYREIPFTQEDDYVEDDPLPADTLEGGFDRAVMRDQQLKDAQDRALTFPVTINPAVSAELPNPQAGAVLGWASDALSLENKVLAPGTTVYASILTTDSGIATNEAVTPAGLAGSKFNPTGLHMVHISAREMELDLVVPPATALVQPTSGRPVYYGLDFDKDNAEAAWFKLPMPESYDGGDIKFKVLWTNAGIVGAGDVSWAISAVSVADGELITQAPPATSISIDTFQGDKLLHVSPFSGNIGITGTPAPGETIWFRVFRNATAGADTYNQDARLLGVRLYFSTSKGNDA